MESSTSIHDAKHADPPEDRQAVKTSCHTAEDMEHQAIIDKLADVRRQCFPGKPCEMKGALLEMRDEIFRLRLKTTTGLEGALKQAEAQLAEARKLLEQVNSLQCREGLDPTPYCDIYDFLHPPAKSTDNPHPGPAMEAEPL
jgi:hypothetical protein